MCLVVSAFAHVELAFKATALLDWVVELAEGVADLHSGHENFETIDHGGHVRVVVGDRGDLEGEFVDHSGLDQFSFGVDFEVVSDGFACGGFAGGVDQPLRLADVVVGVRVVAVTVFDDGFAHGHAAETAEIEREVAVRDVGAAGGVDCKLAGGVAR